MIGQTCNSHQQNVILTAVSVVLVAMVGWAIYSGYGFRRNLDVRPGPPPLQYPPALDGGPGGGPFLESVRHSDVMGLLEREDVRTELKLSASAIRSVQEALADQRPGPPPGNGKAPSQNSVKPPSGDRPEAGGRDRASKRLEGLLTAKQRVRLHELDLQRRGPLAMADPGLAHQLGITEAHRGEISRISGEVDQRMTDVARRTEVSRQSAESSGAVAKPSPGGAVAQQVRKSCERAAMLVLSNEERAAWKKAQGAPFVFAKDDSGPSRFGGWGGPGGPAGPIGPGGPGRPDGPN